jgi:hypothetical protein
MIARQRRLNRMRAVMREYKIARVAARDLQARLRADPSVLADEQLQVADSHNFRDNLESTYLMRLFAEFEAGLREAWDRALGQATSPKMQDLIDSFAARRLIPWPWSVAAHNVRAYRNALLHEGGVDIAPIGMDEAQGHLCRFFSRLPDDW